MNINTATICLLLLLMVGCAPSVRYTRGQQDNRPSSGQRQKVVDGSDSLQSGWETAGRGDAGRRQSDWLAAALSEADDGQSGRRGGANKSGDLQLLRQVVNSYLGVPYKYGGTTRQGFDCSGFVSAVYREVYGMPLKRTSSAMWKDGVPVALSAARPGDLVFFKGGAFGAIDHVGIYMGRTRFVHASAKSGVVYGNLKETYYARRFAGIRRMY